MMHAMTCSNPIYRYQPFRSGDYSMPNLERLLLHDEIRLNSPLSLNDPFDCNPFVSDKGATKEVWEAFFTDYFGRMHSDETPEQIGGRVRKRLESGIWHEGCFSWIQYQLDIEQRIRAGLFTQFGILSFSEQDCTHIRLWGLYADGHRGVCLVFDKTILQTIPGFEEMRYVSSFPTISEWLQCREADTVNGNQDETNRLFILRKFDQWAEEKEWRLWGGTKDTSYCQTKNALVEIILGCEMQQEQADLISRWIIDRHKNTSLRRITLCEARRDPRDYRLKIVPLD
jgi:hypothetical protein